MHLRTIDPKNESQRFEKFALDKQRQLIESLQGFYNHAAVETSNEIYVSGDRIGIIEQAKQSLESKGKKVSYLAGPREKHAEVTSIKAHDKLSSLAEHTLKSFEMDVLEWFLLKESTVLFGNSGSNFSTSAALGTNQGVQYAIGLDHPLKNIHFLFFDKKAVFFCNRKEVESRFVYKEIFITPRGLDFSDKPLHYPASN